MMNISIGILRAGKQILRGIYAPMKLRRPGRRITFISRQSDEPSMDIALLTDFLRENHPDIEIAVLCRKLEGKNPVGYGFHIIKQMWNIAGSAVVVIDGYCIPCSILNHRSETRIIQTWHALAAIKQFGYQSLGKAGGRSEKIAEVLCMHRNYDRVLCPSRVTGDFFCQAFDVEESKLLFMGLPRIDRIVSCKGNGSLRREYGIPEDREIVLYAPTLRKSGEIDITEMAGAVADTGVQLVVCPHPQDDKIVCDRKLLDEGRIIMDGRHGSFDWLCESDKVITDYSAISVEAALAGRKLYFYMPDKERYAEDEGLNVDPAFEMPTLSACDPRSLVAILEKDYPDEELEAFLKKFVEIDSNNCTAKLGEYLYGLVEESHKKIS